MQLVVKSPWILYDIVVVGIQWISLGTSSIGFMHMWPMAPSSVLSGHLVLWQGSVSCLITFDSAAYAFDKDPDWSVLHFNDWSTCTCTVVVAITQKWITLVTWDMLTTESDVVYMCHTMCACVLGHGYVSTHLHVLCILVCIILCIINLLRKLAALLVKVVVCRMLQPAMF